MKYLAAFACLLLWWPTLFAQVGPPPGTDTPPPNLQPATTLEFEPPPHPPVQKQKIRPQGPKQFVEAVRQLGPDLITARLTIDQEILDGLFELLALQPDYRLILAVDHSALSVRYALVHRLLEKMEAYPHVSPRVDIEMYAPISKYHTTWLWERGLGFTMIRLERLSR